MSKSKENITLELSSKGIIIFLLIIILIGAGVFFLPKLVKKISLKKAQPKMLVYKNKEHGVSFQYPSSLVLEEEVTSGENLLTLRFIGKACSHIPLMERPNFPSLTFSISQKDDSQKGIGFCKSNSPNCRGGTRIGPFYLENEMEAEIYKVFGTSTDAIGISIAHEGLVYKFGTTDTATNCGEKYNYILEIFQMANSFILSP